MLLARWEARLAGRAHQPEQHGSLGRVGIPVGANTDRFVQADRVVEAARCRDSADTELVERRPIRSATLV